MAPIFHIYLREILFFAFTLVFSAAFTQSSINYSISEGMPSNEVYDIYQDTEGFLWFATDNGVVRFDGAELKKIHVKDGLSDPVVFGFFEDFKKRIWFRTYSGRLSYFDPETEKIATYPFNDKIAAIVKNGIILSINIDASDNLLISITGLIIKIDVKGTITQTKIPYKSFLYKEVSNGHLIGLNPKFQHVETAIINDTTFPIELSKTTLANHVVCSITVGDKLLFSINDDLFEYRNKKVRKIFTGKSYIISLSKDSKNNVWVGYQGHGVEIINGTTYSSEYFNFIRKKSITKVVEDTESGYWFSTLENGVYYLPDKNIDTLNYPKDAHIKSAVYINNNVIAGDQNGYLHFFSTTTRKETQSLYMGAPIMSLFEDIYHRLWVSTNAEVIVLDSSFKIQKRISPLSKIDFSKDGNNYVWATGALTTLFDIKGEVIRHTKTGTYRSILIKDSLLILSGKIGIEIRNKKSEILASPPELENTKIRKMDLLNDSTAILSSIGNGPILLHLKKYSSEWLNTTKKFPADNIYAVIKADSALWLGTEKGVFKVSNDYLTQKAIPFDHLTALSGLLNNKIDFLVNTKKEIWAFSEDGISIIPLSKQSFENQKPKFYIKNLFANNNKVDMDKEIVLSHEENYLQLDVGFISFNNRNIRIRFKLSPNDEWSYTDNHSIELFSLSPGRYQIDLEYSTNNILWTSAIKDLAIYIKPPWWKLWYNQLIIFLVIVSLILFFIMTRVSLIKQKQIHLQSLTDHQQQIIQSEIESIEKERSRIAKDLHDGIGTTLTSVKMRVNQVLIKYNQPEADTIENRLQDILREVKDIIYDLAPPTLAQFGLHEGLKNYIEKVATGTDIQIKLNIFGEELEDPKVNLFIFRIIQELVVNSLKHANAKNITLHLSTFNDLMNILYEDDGSGFMDTEVTRGHGLYNIESRIQSLNGKILFETSSQGVSYSIDIPLL